MSKPRVYGHTASGRPITDPDIEKLAAEAEAGYDPDALIARRGKRGRPTLGSSPASVESDGSTPSYAPSCSSRRQARAQPPRADPQGPTALPQSRLTPATSVDLDRLSSRHDLPR